MMNKIFFLIFFISIIANGQNSERLLKAEIDSLVSLIPVNPKKPDEFSQIQSSGLISKKCWIFINKTVGSFHEDVIYKNNSIYLIKKFTENRNEIYDEYYYFENGNLIKYVKEIHKNQEVENEFRSVYFQNDKVINGTKIKDLDINRILSYSDNKYSSWIEFINRNE